MRTSSPGSVASPWNASNASTGSSSCASRRFVRTQEFLDELEVSAPRSSATSTTCVTASTPRSSTTATRRPTASTTRSRTARSGSCPACGSTRSELRALLTMDQLIADLQPGVLSELVTPLRKRLKALLESGEHTADDIAHRIRVLSMGSRVIEPGQFGVLSTALLASRRAASIRHTAPPGRRLARARGLAAASRPLPRQLVPRRLVPQAPGTAHVRSRSPSRAPSSIDKAAEGVERRQPRPSLRERLRHLRGRRAPQEARAAASTPPARAG